MTKKTKKIKVTQPDLAKTVLRLREEAGLTQEQVAEAAGMDPKVYRRIEGNKVDPRVSSVARIAYGLNQPTADLMRDVTIAEEHRPGSNQRPDPDPAS
jgi:transcriptional regulator with XRE-family HTH domain